MERILQIKVEMQDSLKLDSRRQIVFQWERGFLPPPTKKKTERATSYPYGQEEIGWSKE